MEPELRRRHALQAALLKERRIMLPKICGTSFQPPSWEPGASGVPASINDELDWTRVMEEIKAGLKQTQISSMQEVWQLIKNATPPVILENKNAIVAEVDMMLDQAKRSDEIDMQEVQRSFDDLPSRIIRECKRSKYGLGPDICSPYGGSLGNDIYQKLTKQYVIPMLSALLVEFNARTTNFSVDERLDAMKVFQGRFFYFAGQARFHIAMVTDTDNAPYFGKLRESYDGRGMEDVVSSWPKWHAEVEGRISSVLVPSVLQFKATGAPAKDFVPKKKTNIYTTGKAKIALDRGNTGRMFESRDADDRAQYLFNWSLNGPEEAPLVITELTCYHPGPVNRQPAAVLAENFSLALRLKDHADGLIPTLAAIFYDCAHMSMFHRGQASIATTTVKAIAHSMGHELEISYPAHWPAPDQVALLMFDDREQFIRDAQTYFSLRPLDA